MPATADPQGGTRQLVAYGSVMNSRVEMELTRLDAGLSTQPPHSHRAAELLIPLNHPVESHIEESLKGAQIGDVIFVESEVSHRIHTRSQEPAPTWPSDCSPELLLAPALG